MALPFDDERLEKLLALIVKGLMWHHWQVLLGPDCFVEVLSLTAHGERFFARYSGMHAAKRVEETTIGDGTFAYKGAQGIDNPQVSVWEFSVYGGLKVTGDNANEGCRRFGAFTGPKRIRESADRRVKAGTIIRP